MEATELTSPSCFMPKLYNMRMACQRDMQLCCCFVESAACDVCACRSKLIQPIRPGLNALREGLRAAIRGEPAFRAVLHALMLPSLMLLFTPAAAWETDMISIEGWSSEAEILRQGLHAAPATDVANFSVLGAGGRRYPLYATAIRGALFQQHCFLSFAMLARSCRSLT